MTFKPAGIHALHSFRGAYVRNTGKMKNALIVFFAQDFPITLQSSTQDVNLKIKIKKKLKQIKNGEIDFLDFFYIRLSNSIKMRHTKFKVNFRIFDLSAWKGQTKFFKRIANVRGEDGTW